MTITSETNRTQTIGNDGVTYPYGFKIWADTDLLVYRSNIASPTSKVEGVLNTHYTVGSVGVSGGGNITLIGDWASSPPDDTEHITCLLDVPYKQEVDIENQGSPEGNTIERMIDKVTTLCLQLQEQYTRCFKVDEVSAEDPDSMTLETIKNAEVDTTNFDGMLSATEDTIQKALDVLDEARLNEAIAEWLFVGVGQMTVDWITTGHGIMGAPKRQPYVAMDPDADVSLTGGSISPQRWVDGNITEYRVYYTTQNSAVPGSDVAKMTLRTSVAAGDGGTYGTQTATTFDATGGTGLVIVKQEAAISSPHAFETGDIFSWSLARDGDNVDDDLPEDLWILGIEFKYEPA